MLATSSQGSCTQGSSVVLARDTRNVCTVDETLDRVCRVMWCSSAWRAIHYSSHAGFTSQACTHQQCERGRHSRSAHLCTHALMHWLIRVRCKKEEKKGARKKARLHDL